jgi:hypothetical protein
MWKDSDMDPIDAGLAKLRAAPAGRRLDGLEYAVAARLDRSRGDVFRGHTLKIQLAVSCAALLVGLAVAQLAAEETAALRSEAAVLSGDSMLAPSIAIEGGA